jgi:hypothetical protein
LFIKSYLDVDGVDTHQRGFTRFGAIAQNGRLPVKLAPKVFDFTMDTLNWPGSAQ